MDRSNRKVAQLRPRLRGATKTAAVEFALRGTGWSAQTPRPIAPRPARPRPGDQRWFFCAGRSRSWRGNAGGNCALNHFRSSTRRRHRFGRIVTRAESINPQRETTSPIVFADGMQDIGAVILAAGGSSRFGQPKQLIQFPDKSLVRQTVDLAIEAGCQPVAVVIGSDGKKIKAELKDALVAI